MGTNNTEIRKAIKDAGLMFWQVADVLGMHDSNFSRLLRKELSTSDRERVLAAVNKAKEVYAP